MLEKTPKEFCLASLTSEVVEAENDRAIFGNSNSDLDGDIQERDLLAELAKLPPLQRERRIQEIAGETGLSVTVYRDAVKEFQRAKGDGNNDEDIFPHVEPWPTPVDGVELLTSLSAAINTHVVMDRSSADATALWIMHTYVVDSFSTSPRLAITSPEPECGKTTLLDVVEKLSFRPMSCDGIQAAGVFRTIEALRPTMLIDEADTFLKDNDHLRGVLNSGHRAGKGIIRCDGDDNKPKKFHTYGAIAIAQIGQFPPTLHSRSITVSLQRARQEEKPQRFRYDRTPHLDQLARKALRWAIDNRERVAGVDPDVGGLFNRVADNWRTLFTIADVIGGEWIQRSRHAASIINRPNDENSVSAMLLEDIRDIIKDVRNIRSADLAVTLAGIEGRPWAEWKGGKPITANTLARLLKRFNIHPNTKRDGAETFKGYTASDFAEAFERYLTSPSVTSSQHQENQGESPRTETSHKQECDGSKGAQNTSKDGVCYGVTVQSPDPADDWQFNREAGAA